MDNKKRLAYFFITFMIIFLTSCNNQLQGNVENSIDNQNSNLESIEAENQKESIEIQSSSSLLSENSVIQTEDLQLVPIYHFFNHYFDTYKKCEIQDFTGIMDENDETSLFTSFLKYQLYKQTKNDFFWKNYSFKLTDINKKKAKNECLISVNCEVEFILSDAEDESGAVIPYEFTLKEIDDKWIITNIKEESRVPNFLESFRKQVDDLAVRNKTRQENINDATQYLMDNYE